MEITEDDQKVDPINEARYGRQLKPGTHPATVVKVEEGYTNGGKPKVVVTVVVEASQEDAPEGFVRIDFNATAGFSLRNVVETFEPAKLGKAAKLDLESYVGRKLKVLTKWENESPRKDGNGTYPAKAAIVRLIPPAIKPVPTKDEQPF